MQEGGGCGPLKPGSQQVFPVCRRQAWVFSPVLNLPLPSHAFLAPVRKGWESKSLLLCMAFLQLPTLFLCRWLHHLSLLQLRLSQTATRWTCQGSSVSQLCTRLWTAASNKQGELLFCLADTWEKTLTNCLHISHVRKVGVFFRSKSQKFI